MSDKTMATIKHMRADPMFYVQAMREQNKLIEQLKRRISELEDLAYSRM